MLFLVQSSVPQAYLNDVADWTLYEEFWNYFWAEYLLSD